LTIWWADAGRPFDEILDAYRELAVAALFTLHVDLRCDIILTMAHVLHSPYVLDPPAREADPGVLALNSDLIGFDESLKSLLPDREYQFIVTGLGLLVDEFLISNASKISGMNGNGCGRMQLNILVLQQNLKSIEKDAMLSRSAQYFHYFGQGPKAIVARAKESGGKDMGFNLEEAKVLVELCYSEALRSPQREVAMQARKALDDDNMQLTEYMWSA
jgi:exocyst complex component 4